MKRFLAIIVAVLHLASATGATLRTHYCMGDLIGTELAPHFDADGDHHVCGKCGMEKGSSQGCCKDKHSFIKDASDKAHQHAFQFAFDAPPALLPPSIVPCYGEPRSDFFAAVRAVPVSNAPPPVPPVPLFVRDCSFLI
jgi:hypothetical protein